MLNRLLRACMDYLAPLPSSPVATRRVEPGEACGGVGVAGAGAHEQGPPELCRARQLIAAVDKGGLPLNPAIVNQIARGLGLEVSSKAPIGETVERIRQALDRAGPPSVPSPHSSQGG